MRIYFLIIALCFPVAICLKAQKINGRVVDSKTAAALPFASVFINNTTIGTATDANGEFSLTGLKTMGAHELVFSFLGYKTYKTEVVVSEGTLQMGNINLVSGETQLDLVEVSATRDKEWERKIKKFKKLFLGEDKLAIDCKIVNPWVIDFPLDNHGHKFIAKATAPIEIDNRSLGYKVTFFLDDFWNDDTGYFIGGYAWFTELKSDDPKEITKWELNRKKSFQISKDAFFNSNNMTRVAGILPLDFEPTSFPIEENHEFDEFKDSIQSLINLDSFVEKADRYSEKHPIEKVFVHLDKPFYILGEDSWYKAYVVTSDLSPTEISTVLYLDWIDPKGKIVGHQRLKINGGNAVGDFTFETTLTAGIYTLRAYTNWIRNEGPELFYSKKISVFDTRTAQAELGLNADSRKIDLQFFPEGGTLVAGIQTRIAFKALGGNGQGVDVSGEILDEQNRHVTTFKSAHNGMGLFQFIPYAQKSYHAVLQSGEVYSFPVASPDGLELSASNINDSKIVARIQSSSEHKSLMYLIGYSQGSICYAALVKMDGISKDISISKKEMPEGVLRLTLFNAEFVPQCERLVFVRKNDSMIVTIEGAKEHYASRDSVILNLAVNDNEGNAPQTSLSISVTDGSLINADANAENIYTRLLLQSDIRGSVENPGWYFEARTLERTLALDLVMLTNGWSRFNWDGILNARTDSSFVPERGITIEGKILHGNRPVANTPFFLTALNRKTNFSNSYVSDSNGHFIISGLDFSDSTMFSWLVIDEKKGTLQNVDIQLETLPEISPAVQFDSLRQNYRKGEYESFQKIEARYAKAGWWNLGKATVLDEVVVQAQKEKVKIVNGQTIAVQPDAQDLKSKISTLTFIGRYAVGLPFATLREMSDGTQIWGSMGARGFRPFVVVIDGIRAETTGVQGNPDLILSAIPIDQIDQVHISSSTNIAVWTKNLTRLREPGAMQLKLKGYDTAREFYHPKYTSADMAAPSIDSRITLFWNANLKTNKDGKATVKFYNTDTTKKFLVTVQGIANGLTISASSTIGKD